MDELLTVAQRLIAAAETLAALGAELRIRHEGLTVDPRVRARLDDVVGALGEGVLTGAPERQVATLGAMRALFRQAAELFDHPDRPPGWNLQDPDLLQSQGRASMMVEGMIGTVPGLAGGLDAPGAAFLDVGSGVAWLSIAMAKAWPTLRVVGLDPWEPAVSLARRNVVEAGVGDRVELRPLPVGSLEDEARYTLAWVPGPFLAPDVVGDAVARVRRSLVPGGRIVFGLYGGSSDPLGASLTALRVVRSGGHPWTVAEIRDLLGERGFEEIGTFLPSAPIHLVYGTRR